jgi:hypothetical protein
MPYRFRSSPLKLSRRPGHECASTFLPVKGYWKLKATTVDTKSIAQQETASENEEF